MDGKIIFIVGGRGTGKTTELRGYTEKTHPDALLLYDAGGNHKDYYKRPLLEIDEFVTACRKIENGVMAFEEATIFFRHSPMKDVVDFCVKSRYRQNTIFFVFHSLRSIPFYIYELADFIILFKTKDTEKIVRERFDDDDLINVFNRVNASPDLHAKEIHQIK